MLCATARFVARLGLRRPEQRERLQWPYPRHLRGKGCTKAAERGGNGVRAASKA